MARRRFQKPEPEPRDVYGPWMAVIAVLLLAWTVFVVLADFARADHDGADQPWRRPILAACEPRWDPANPRIVTYDGRTLHMERAHADPALDPRIMFYLTWGSDDLDAGTHLRRWRWEYECTHPKPDETMPALVTVGARLPRGGGGPVFVHSGPSPPPGYPSPTPTPEGPESKPPPPEEESPTPEPTDTETPTPTPTPTGWKWHCHERNKDKTGYKLNTESDCTPQSEGWSEECDSGGGSCDYRTSHRHDSFTWETPTPHDHQWAS